MHRGSRGGERERGRGEREREREREREIAWLSTKVKGGLDEVWKGLVILLRLSVEKGSWWEF